MSRYRYIVCRPRHTGTEVNTLREAKGTARNLSIELPYLYEVWRVTGDGAHYLLYTACDGRLRTV